MSRVMTRDEGVGSWVERRARISPDRPALIAGDRTVTYAQLAVRIRCLANGLRSLGVAHGDRVGWLGRNHTAFLETLLAAGQLGAALAPVNHRLEPDVRSSILAETGPVVLVEHDMSEETSAPTVRHRVVVGWRADGGIDYEALIAASTDAPAAESVSLDDLLLLPHTSGTTGSPKAVMLTHGNVTWNAVNFLTIADLRPYDVTIAIAPFFRSGGTGVNVLPVLFVGGTVVVPEDPAPDEILRLIERHRVTVGFGNPDLLDTLVRADGWASVDLSSVRFVVTGGAPVPERLIRAYLVRGVTLLQGYGLSEAGPLALLLDPEQALSRIGSAGKPPLLVDVRIVDEHERDVRPGRTGELLVRGPNVMAGYWRRPEETRRALADGGWLRTGDAARTDDEGYVWIVDRLEARFVSSGGEIVYPGDVERALMEHPSVADAGVIGVAGPDGGTEGRAFVVLAAGATASEEELIAFCRDRLAPHETPTSVRFADALPRNAVGKLVRAELASLASGARRDEG